MLDGDYNKILCPTAEQIKVSVLGDPPKKCCTCRCIDTYVTRCGTVIYAIRKTVLDIYAKDVKMQTTA